mmetsp:Transcript_15314/g.51696  ORF Transcript_15314/g.51696 Transcript_15314/m.51696 type:complete len:204 (-) Transcript_15314:522-1133(-)
MSFSMPSPRRWCTPSKRRDSMVKSRRRVDWSSSPTSDRGRVPPNISAGEPASSTGMASSCCRARCMSASTRSPVAAEMAISRLCPMASRRAGRRLARRSRACGRSILFTATTWGLVASTGEKSSSSAFTAWRSPTGSGLSPATTWMRRRHRSMWRRKARPRPTPSWAPSRRPGMSAITMPASPVCADDPLGHTPRLGTTVVNG